MREFKGGAEIRITSEDLKAALEYVINEQLFGGYIYHHKVDSVSLHPGNKYVARVTISMEK